MDTQSLKATEEVGARGATHPRVTLEDIKSSIALLHFSTADALLPPELPEGAAQHVGPLKILTLCVLVMRNGFVVVGKSAPASPENYTQEKGEQFAYEDAVRQIWPLMGFALRDRLHRDQADTEHFNAVTDGNATPATGTDFAELVGTDQPEELANEATGTGTMVPDASPVVPAEIPGDEELEASDDQPIKDLALAHGLDYVDRADAIDQLKRKRAALSGQANPL